MVLNASPKSKWSTTPTRSQRTHVDHRTFRLATGSGRRVEAARRPVARDHGGQRGQHGGSARDEWVRRRRGRRDGGGADRCRVGGRGGRDRRRGRPLRLARARSRSGTQCTAHRHRRSHARRRARSHRAWCVGDRDGRAPARAGRRRRRGGRRVGARARVGTAGRAASSPAHQRMAAIGQSRSRPRVRCERLSRPRGTPYRGEHRRGDRFREPCADAGRSPHPRTSTRTLGARPGSRAGRGARAAGSRRRCFPHDANTRLWSLPERGRARRPTGAEPR